MVNAGPVSAPGRNTVLPSAERQQPARHPGSSAHQAGLPLRPSRATPEQPAVPGVPHGSARPQVRDAPGLPPGYAGLLAGDSRVVAEQVNRRFSPLPAERNPGCVLRRMGKAVRSVSHDLVMCVIEARPSVLVISLLRFLAPVALAARAWPGAHPGRVAAVAILWQLTVASVYVFNGVTDIREDRINGSRRPIARGALSLRSARSVAAGAAVTALAGGIAVHPVIGGAVVAYLILGYLYSGPPAYLKRRPVGAIMTAMTPSILTYYAGLLSAGRMLPDATMVILAIAMSLWMGLVGVLTKDLSDVPGDTAAGRRTAVILCGQAKARRLTAAAAAAIAVVFALMGIPRDLSLLWPVMAMTLGAVTLMVLALTRFSCGNRLRCRRLYRAYMGTQYAVHLSVVGTAMAPWVFPL